MDVIVKQFLYVFLLFFGYSVLGYIVEIIFCTFHEKKVVVNRGFLLGPYLPIYGVGAIVIIYWLYRYQNDIVALFIMGAVVCSFVEYFTSLIMEKLFKIRWWDYSHMKLNLNGRICLSNSVLFGLGGILIMKVINPFYMRFLSSIPSFLFYFIGGFFFVVFLADVILSIVILVQLKLNSNMFMNKDATEEIKQRVHDTLMKKNYFISRILRAFPKITLINDKKVKEFNDYLEKLRRERKLQKRQKKPKAFDK